MEDEVRRKMENGEDEWDKRNDIGGLRKMCGDEKVLRFWNK